MNLYEGIRGFLISGKPENIHLAEELWEGQKEEIREISEDDFNALQTGFDWFHRFMDTPEWGIRFYNKFLKQKVFSYEPLVRATPDPSDSRANYLMPYAFDYFMLRKNFKSYYFYVANNNAASLIKSLCRLYNQKPQKVSCRQSIVFRASSPKVKRIKKFIFPFWDISTTKSVVWAALSAGDSFTLSGKEWTIEEVITEPYKYPFKVQ